MKRSGQEPSDTHTGHQTNGFPNQGMSTDRGERASSTVDAASRQRPTVTQAASAPQALTSALAGGRTTSPTPSGDQGMAAQATTEPTQPRYRAVDALASDRVDQRILEADMDGLSPLISLETHNEASIVRFGLDRGPSAPQSPDQNGARLALCLAARDGDATAVAGFLEAGVQLALAEDAQRNTPLMLATVNGYVDVVKVLLAQPGIEVDKTNADGDTALILAVEHNRPAVAACLVEAGAQVDRLSGDPGHTALMHAAGLGHIPLLALLLAQPGLELDKCCQGLDALMFAALSNKPDAVACLLKAGAQMKSAKSDEGHTALMYASTVGHIDVVRLLLKQPGVDLDGVTMTEKRSALMLAAREGHAEVVACLLDAQASTNLVDSDGRTALQWAIDKSHGGVVDVFLRDGKGPDDTLVDFMLANPTPFGLLVADVLADRRGIDTTLPSPGDADAFFSGLVSTFSFRPENDPVRWMCAHGIRGACLLQVHDAQIHLANMSLHEPRYARFKMTYCLSGLSRISVQDANDGVLALYRESGFDEETVERLGRVAIKQVGDLVRLATATLERIGAEMAASLVASCTAATKSDASYQTGAVRMSVEDLGYSPAAAHAIATSWEKMLRVTRARVVVASARRTGIPMTGPRDNPIAEDAPALFAAELLRQLDSDDCMAELLSILGDPNHEVMHAQFQIQCDQLRQYCRQTLNLPESTLGTSSTSSTSSTTSTTSTSRQQPREPAQQ